MVIGVKEAKSVIEVKNVVKCYGNHVAVDHLSFQIEKGKIYGFLGPNGAGKSTTMNMITGYVASTEGEISINGYDILEESEKAKKCIGYLPEVPPLYLDMTVAEYLEFAADLKKIPRKEKYKSIEDVMETVKIMEVQNRLIKNLSKGYRQRVGLAQAILGYPEVIILDEPTVGLDPKQIIEIRNLIKELKKKHTVILSSHILSEVSALCDYILIISHGKLVASDTPENLSKLAAGSNEITMLIKGKKETIEMVLTQISNIKDVKFVKKTEDGCWNVKVISEEQKDVREQIFYGMAENMCAILEMHTKKISLEEIFLELTENEKGTEKEAAKGGDEETRKETKKEMKREVRKKIENKGGKRNAGNL